MSQNWQLAFEDSESLTHLKHPWHGSCDSSMAHLPVHPSAMQIAAEKMTFLTGNNWHEYGNVCIW